jgi:hypothetical protein
MFKTLALKWLSRKIAGYAGVAGALSLDNQLLAIGAAIVTVIDLGLSLKKEIDQAKQVR